MGVAGAATARMRRLKGDSILPIMDARNATGAPASEEGTAFAICGFLRGSDWLEVRASRIRRVRAIGGNSGRCLPRRNSAVGSRRAPLLYCFSAFAAGDLADPPRARAPFGGHVRLTRCRVLTRRIYRRSHRSRAPRASEPRPAISRSCASNYLGGRIRRSAVSRRRLVAGTFSSRAHRFRRLSHISDAPHVVPCLPPSIYVAAARPVRDFAETLRGSPSPGPSDSGAIQSTCASLSPTCVHFGRPSA